jgi:Domain of unknown function (DUF4384)
MRAAILKSLMFAMMAAGAITAPGQDDNNATGARSAFLDTRKKLSPATGPKNPRPGPTRPAQTGGNQSIASTQPMGFGYTIYKRLHDDKPVTVNPSTVFREGDEIRIVIESNAGGYLYIFHTEDGEGLQMLFPDARLNGGDNKIGAHVPYEVPSSKERDPNSRWFRFDENPAREQLYFVVTKNPLAGVPVGRALVDYCQKNADSCPYKPAGNVWEVVRSGAAARHVVNSRDVFGEEQEAVERDAISRGIGLPKSAPEPSVIRINSSPTAALLVTMIELIHK